MLTTGKKPLSIALLGMNDRAKSRMELFLDHYWSSDCILVGDRFADLCILDLDSPNGRETLRQQQERYPDRPLIVLTVHDANIKDVTTLRKPLKGELLKQTIDDHKSALAQRSSLEKTQPTSAEAKPAPITPNRERKSTKQPRSTHNDRRSALPNLITQARIIRGSCSTVESIHSNSALKNDSLYYDPRSLFQQALKNHIDQCRNEDRPLRLNLSDDKFIVLLPESNLALTNLNDNKLRSRCLLPISQYQVRTDYPDDSEIQQLRDREEAPQDIDYLLWKVSLLSSRGRLPLGTHIDSVIALKQWPNMTRLLIIPQFLRIAALWTKTPLPLNKTIELLNIEARYVCAFFSACLALELTQVLSSGENHEIFHPPPEQDAAPQGLLRRILRRLRVA